MRFPLVLTILVLGLGFLAVYQNPAPIVVTFYQFEVQATEGVIWASALGLGVLTGVVAMLTRDVPRMRRIRTLDVEE